jgi:hypothetical protein
VSLGSSVAEIGDGAFASAHIRYNGGMGHWAHCTGEYVFGNDGECALEGMSAATMASEMAIESLVLSDSVSRIGAYAFFLNSKLTTVAFPSSVKTIGARAFYKNEALSSISFGNGSVLTTIGSSAFSNTVLTSVVIPDSVTTLGSSAFSMSKLTSVVLPASLKTINDDMFQCTPLTAVQIPDSVERVENGVFSCKNLARGYISPYSPCPINTISQSSSCYSFAATSLASITFGANVSHVGEEAFAGANITSLTIPSSVTRIETWAFLNCSRLQTVVIQSTNLAFGMEVYYPGAPKAQVFSHSNITSLTMPQALYDTLTSFTDQIGVAENSLALTLT